MEKIFALMDRTLHGNNEAQSGVDLALHDMLQVWNPNEKTYKLMAEDTLRKIIAKRGARRE